MRILGYLLIVISLSSGISLSSAPILYRRIKEDYNLIICQDYRDMSRKGVEIFISRLQDILRKKEKAVVLIPTGGTYLNSGGFYDILIAEYKQKIDWSRVIFMNLDEYVGVSPSSPQSYNYQLTQVLRRLGVPEENIFLFDGSKDPQKQCQKREEMISQAGGIDIALLGIGRNGHIAFNEPGAEKNSITRVVELTPETKIQNGSYFGGEEYVPSRAITVGIKTILSARIVILLASGESKSRAVSGMLKGENPHIPASYLLSHPQLILVLDRSASKYISSE